VAAVDQPCCPAGKNLTSFGSFGQRSGHRLAVAAPVAFIARGAANIVRGAYVERRRKLLDAMIEQGEYLSPDVDKLIAGIRRGAPLFGIANASRWARLRAWMSSDTGPG
jgi:hypothetical protein